MSSFTANQMYNVVTENELAEVLSHYSSDFVYSIVDNAIRNRFNTIINATAIPNVVAAWEQNFKYIESIYGSDSKEKVRYVRNETYREIIDTICREFGLSFTIDDSIDLFSAAYHLYDFFISKFATNIVQFFSSFIYKERSNIYDALGLAELKKNKDGSTTHAKKTYKDIKIAIIYANIDTVINYVCSLDIPFHSIIGMVCGSNSELRNYYLSIVSADQEFFKRAFASIFTSEYRVDAITAIRFEIHSILKSLDQVLTTTDVFNIGDEDVVEDNTEEEAE